MSFTSNSDYDQAEDWLSEDEEDMDWRRSYLSKNRYEFCDLPLPEGYTSTKWIAAGTFAGDIKWNDSTLAVQWECMHSSGRVYTAKCRIAPFTNNCGIKAVAHIWIDTDNLQSAFLGHLESFLKNCLNVGLMIGSDCNAAGYMGTTSRTIETYGSGYVFTDHVWNPNYTWDENHKIFLFYKDLTKHDYPDIWKG